MTARSTMIQGESRQGRRCWKASRWIRESLQMIYVEILAALFGFLSVVFYILRLQWSWPVGFVQVVLYIVVFYGAKLYADMMLHIVYSILQVYGWWAWHQSRASEGKSGEPTAVEIESNLLVRRLPLKGHLVCGMAGVVMTLVYTYLLESYTDASAPLLDSSIVSLSLIAQMLLAWRYLDNWWYWMAVDVLGVGVFAARRLYPTAILYFVFLGMAIVGFRAWEHARRRQLRTEVVAT